LTAEAHSISRGLHGGPVLAARLNVDMRLLWWIPIAAVFAGAGLLFRARKRRQEGIDVTSEPVSSEWLAQARGRDEHQW